MYTLANILFILTMPKTKDKKHFLIDEYKIYAYDRKIVNIIIILFHFIIYYYKY